MSKPVTLAQIVAALSVSDCMGWTPVAQRDEIGWSSLPPRPSNTNPLRTTVRRIGDADPADFTITDTRSGT